MVLLGKWSLWDGPFEIICSSLYVIFRFWCVFLLEMIEGSHLEEINATLILNILHLVQGQVIIFSFRFYRIFFISSLISYLSYLSFFFIISSFRFYQIFLIWCLLLNYMAWIFFVKVYNHLYFIKHVSSLSFVYRA